jgi:hypothetical protein
MGYKYSNKVVEMVMTQLSLKAALKQWGEDAKAAVEAEAKQLHWHNFFPLGQFTGRMSTRRGRSKSLSHMCS